ncbi:unnamed protein product [Peronospora destructor]|uniref:Uncharacterized protein n=1 Tax=Peronospora destructor TaxID=86335 RepID=A0AAV0VEZ5_9STRA|nr:unnamed protein product [Peronospora destructor]
MAMDSSYLVATSTASTWLSNLPAFLVPEGGLNSGFSIAASLVSENKVLTHPSSVDSISTRGTKEDHVLMDRFAAHKALTVMHLRLFTHLRTHALKFYKDRVMKSDIDALLDLVRSGAICEVAAPFLTELHVLEL